MNTEEYLRTNLKNWNERVAIHAEDVSDSYDIEGFLAGGSTLNDIEITELGDVSGKNLLHLMCHFGLDTLSWARRGARVTGVDFSPEAINLARSLAERSALDARFVCSDVSRLRTNLCGEFDIVFASYGVLCWIPDIREFMQIASSFLRPGGIFCLVDGHPFLDILEWNDTNKELQIQYSYFHQTEPDACVSTHSYTNITRKLTNTRTYEWTHHLSLIMDCFQVTTQAGLA